MLISHDVLLSSIFSCTRTRAGQSVTQHLPKYTATGLALEDTIEPPASLKAFPSRRSPDGRGPSVPQLVGGLSLQLHLFALTSLAFV